MAKSISLTGNVRIADDTTTLCQDAISASENITESLVLDFSLAASATDVSLDFSAIGTDVPLLVVIPSYVSSGYITAKVNGGVENIPIGKLGVLGGTTANGIDSLSLSNPDATNAVGVKVYLGK